MTKSQRASRGAKSNRSNPMENEIISRRHATHAASMRDIKSAFAPPTPSNRAHFRRTIALSTRAAPPGTPPPAPAAHRIRVVGVRCHERHGSGCAQRRIRESDAATEKEDMHRDLERQQPGRVASHALALRIDERAAMMRGNSSHEHAEPAKRTSGTA